MRAVRVHETGGPEVLRLDEDVAVADPGAGQARVRVAAAGLNYIDTYHRSGSYPLELPAVIGMEGAGTVEAVGEDVTHLAVGDRVAWAMQLGSYAEEAVVDAWRLAAVPEAVDLDTAAAVMLQGTTAHYLSHSTFPLGPDRTALVLAAAGGVGHLLVQLAHRAGARVLAAVSTDDKAELVRRLGADEVIRYDEVGLDEAARELTDGRGVDVVYDGVGQATWDASLDSLRPRGMMVLYGAASGPVGPVDIQVLNRKGSLFLTRPSLAHHLADREEVAWRTGELFDAIAGDGLEVRVDRAFDLAEAAEAHRYIEARRTKGKVLLRP